MLTKTLMICCVTWPKMARRHRARRSSRSEDIVRPCNSTALLVVATTTTMMTMTRAARIRACLRSASLRFEDQCSAP